MRAKTWTAGYFIIVIGILAITGIKVVMVDPFFHFHKPNTDKYFYVLNNERSQNDGIMRHFDYDALITGTSMTENFKTTEMDSVFGVNSIKVSFSGAPYKEINNNLVNALTYNPKLKTIIRSLDMNYFFDDCNRMRTELGIYPTYLYDNNIFNDVKYIFNRDIIFKWVYEMEQSRKEDGFVPGITSFDDYENWADNYTYGAAVVCAKGITAVEPATAIHLTEAEKASIYNNIYSNVVSLAEKHPDVTFYCFIPPYSIVWWQPLVASGEVYRQIEAEEYIIEQILACENIKLFSFNSRTDIITDLNNYKDAIHYGPWINSLILKWMHEDQYLLTKENYKTYLSNELSFYISYDYSLLQEQNDYRNDYFADALLNKELNDVKPLNILVDLNNMCAFENAILSEDDNETNLLMKDEYCGFMVSIEEIDNYRYLVFDGKKNSGQGKISLYVYNESNEQLIDFMIDYTSLDNEWHQYLLDIAEITGNITILLNNTCSDAEATEASYIIKNIVLY